MRQNGRDPRELRLPDAPGHADVHPFVLFLDRPVDWTAFGIWLTMLLASRGADLLRVKGLLDVGAAGPVVLNGVQHVVHPPEHLEAWPDDDRRSRLVLDRWIPRIDPGTGLLPSDVKPEGHMWAYGDTGSDLYPHLAIAAHLRRAHRAPDVRVHPA